MIPRTGGINRLNRAPKPEPVASAVFDKMNEITMDTKSIMLL